MNNLLITGGAGFIGTNFVHYWLGKYPFDNVFVLDSLTYAGTYENFFKAEEKSNFEFVKGDITDQNLVETILTSRNISLIVHFAAESHVDRSIQGPDLFIQTNIVGTHSLLKAAKKKWVDGKINNHHFHHISTDEVYGSLCKSEPAFSESNAYYPNSPYAASKASSDHLVRAYHKTYGLNVTTSNCSNNYGPYQFPEKLIPMIISNICDGNSLPIYGDGEQVRDWLYVEDHCRGIDLIIKKGRFGETYNIGGSNEWVNLDLFHMICDIVDEKFEEDPNWIKQFPNAPKSKGYKAIELITHIKDRAGHDRRYAINSSKINSELGFKPEESFDSGILKTVDWYLKNETWWRRCMEKRN